MFKIYFDIILATQSKKVEPASLLRSEAKVQRTADSKSAIAWCHRSEDKFQPKMLT